jgi:hypothetical protein
MNANGTRVAIGATGNDGPNTGTIPLDNRGHVRVYEYNGSAWDLIQEINGDFAGDESGFSVSMSANGTRVAIGAINNDGMVGTTVLSNSGHVRVFSLPAPTTAHQSVEVNLGIAVDASGTINIFGQVAPTVSNIIVAKVKLPAAALYSSGSNSMFEFWEPSAARGNRLAQLAANEGRNWKLLTRKLANGIHACLEGKFDATLASPFNDNTKYGAVHREDIPNFGEVALRSYAHYTLGHVDATAAITNDVAFVSAMLERDSTPEGVEDDFSTVAAGTKAKANLANLLVKAIVTKNDEAILAIAEQVLGQDGSRAMDEDNNELTVDKKQALKFLAGDIIYMNIKLQKPEVLVGTGQQMSESAVEDKFTAEQNYTLMITLS